MFRYWVCTPAGRVHGFSLPSAHAFGPRPHKGHSPRCPGPRKGPRRVISLRRRWGARSASGDTRTRALTKMLQKGVQLGPAEGHGALRGWRGGRGLAFH